MTNDERQSSPAIPFMSAAAAVVRPDPSAVPAIPSPDPARRAPGELAGLLVLAAVFFTVAVDYVVMMPLGPQLQAAFGINIQQFNFAVGAYALAAGLSGLGASLVMDRFDRKRALLFLYAGFTVGTVGCALAPTFEWLVAMRALAGLFGGVVGGVVLAILGDTIPEARRGAAVGIVTAAFPLAQVLGVPLSLWLAHRFSWHVPFSGLAALSVVIGVGAGLLLPRVRGHLRAVAAGRAAGETALGQLWATVADRNHVRALLVTAGISASGFLIVIDLAAFMVHNVGLPEGQLFWIYAASGACTLWTMPLAGRLADRLGKRRVFTAAMLAAAASMLALTQMPAGSGVILAAVMNSVFMVCTTSRYVSAMAMVTAAVVPKHRGGFMSVNSALSHLVAAPTAVLAGWLVTEGAGGHLRGFGSLGVVAAGITVATLLVGRTLRKVDEEGDGPTAAAGHP